MHRVAKMPVLSLVPLVAIAVLLAGCQERHEADPSQPSATKTAQAVLSECDSFSGGLRIDMGDIMGFAHVCAVWDTDPLGCSDEFAAVWYKQGGFCGPDDIDGCSGTDFIGGLADFYMVNLRHVQQLGCPDAESTVEIAAKYAAEYFLLGQPSVPEALKRQLLPATKRWIAGTDAEARSEALDEMAMLASLYRATSPQPIIFIAPAASSGSRMRQLEWQVFDLKGDIDRLNLELNR